VATGLGQSETQAKTPVSLVQAFSQQAELEEPLDYKALEKPTVIRHSSPRDRKVVGSDTSMDYLDVPAFLRRQAD
jgi:cell division protein FtsZ